MAILRRAEYVTLGMGAGQRCRVHGPDSEQRRAGEVKIGGDNFAVIVIIYAGNVALLGRFGCACTRL